MKNFDFRKALKRLMSLGTAFVLMYTPTMAKSESNESERNNDFFQGTYDVDSDKMVLYDYIDGVQESYECLDNLIGYPQLLGDLQNLYAMVNREYLADGVEEDLIANGLIYETDFSAMKYQSFTNAYNLINMIGDHNQSTMQRLNNRISLDKVHYESYDRKTLVKYLKKAINDSKRKYTVIDAIWDYNKEIEKTDETKVIELDDMCHSYDNDLKERLIRVVKEENYDLFTAIKEYDEFVTIDVMDKLIDVSVLCYNEDEKELVHEMHMNYYNAYEEGLIDGDYVSLLFDQLTTLNATEKAGNAHELSVGARWLVLNTIGGGFMQMLRDFMQPYPREELDKYFDANQLNHQQWVARSDKSFDIDCIENELELAAGYFREGWVFIYDHVNDDIMRTYKKECNKNK